MNHFRIDPPTRSAVAAASALLDQHDVAVAALHVRVDELQQRRDALAARLQAHDGTRPAQSVSYDEEMVAALAADPSLAHDTVAISSKLAEEREANRLWDTQRGLFQQALAKIDAELSDLRSQIATEEAAKQNSYREFVLSANSYLIAKFVDAMTSLKADILDPLSQLADEKQGGERIIRLSHPHIDTSSAIKVEYYQPDVPRCPDAVQADIDKAMKECGHATHVKDVVPGGHRSLQLYPRSRYDQDADRGSIEGFRTSLRGPGRLADRVAKAFGRGGSGGAS